MDSPWMLQALAERRPRQSAGTEWATATIGEKKGRGCSEHVPGKKRGNGIRQKNSKAACNMDGLSENK